MNRAIFLDRDGTLIHDRVYLADPAGVELIPGCREALHELRDLGHAFFLFTNQSGIGRGLHTLDDTHRVNARLEELIGLPPPLFTAVGIAPETPDEPPVYRKPSPRFILEQIALHHLDPAACWMVGDSAADIGAALAAGIRPAAVRTGKADPRGLPVVAEHAVPVFAGIREFAAAVKAAFLADARTRRG